MLMKDTNKQSNFKNVYLFNVHIKCVQVCKKTSIFFYNLLYYVCTKFKPPCFNQVTDK